MNEQTVLCKLCDRPYTIFPFYAGDQSVCPTCINKAKKIGNNFNICDNDPNICYPDLKKESTIQIYE
jgi:hypothetical protein